MNTNDETGEREIDFIDILVFSLGENRFALDMTQILRIDSATPQKGSKIKFTGFHEKIGYGKKDFSYKVPKAIFLNDCQEDNAILIESPEDIISIPVRDIQPMPYLIDRCSNQKAIWGATFINDDIVFLVDLQKFKET